MKILHVVQAYTPALGGTEVLIQNISERLALRYGDEVTVFTTTAAKNCRVFWAPTEPTLPAGTEEINRVTVRRFPVFNRFGHIRRLVSQLADRAGLPYRDWGRALFNGPIVFGMTRAIAGFGADVVGASSFPFLHMHFALAGAKQSGAPAALHGALHPTDAWSFERPLIYRAIRQADAYIANSRFEQEYLVGRGIPAASISTIGPGVDIDRFARADGRALRAKLGWGNEPVVAFVGQFTPRKGVPLLLAAMRRVWASFPEARLLLAGASGSSLALIAPEAGRFPQRTAVMADFDEKDKPGIFAACDVLVLPSAEESFGIVFLEAWACRKPVIGLKAGAIPSVVADGVDGLLVAPDDVDDLARAICQALARPELQVQLGQAGYQKVRQNYTWDIVTDRFRQVYTCLTEQRREKEKVL